MAFDFIPAHISVPKPSAPALAGSAGRAWARRALLAARAEFAGERERTQGHGHGMARNRAPKTDRGLPHDNSGREGGQPYAREVEDYSGGGVTRQPDEQTGTRDKPRSPRGS